MRLAFMGTPAFAVPVLDALVEAGHEILAVYSQPPRPTGRGHRVQPSPVHLRAAALGLAVRTPATLKADDDRAAFRDLDLDATVVAAYGLILPLPVLAAPRLGCINVHASLLPRWRGAAPIQRAIMAGDTETGITIMRMERGLDTGPMLLRRAIPIPPDATGPSLTEALAQLGAVLAVEALDRLTELIAEPQPEQGVTYAAKIERGEGALDWRERAGANERKVRALAPGAWFTLAGDRIKVLEAVAEPGAGTPGTVLDRDLGIACAEGVFRPVVLQRPGRGPVDRRAFLNGTRIDPGTILACPATS
jgi:methionyl-tRNA formyltransferase